jgi:hypothetical protein
MNPTVPPTADPVEQAINQLHTDPSLTPEPLYRALLDITVGPLLACFALMLGIRELVDRTPESGSPPMWSVWAILFVLGVTSILDGQRCLMYRSNHQLAVHMAQLIRRANQKDPTS